MAAANSGQIAAFEAESLRMQAEMAAENIRQGKALSEIVEEFRELNTSIDGLRLETCEGFLSLESAISDQTNAIVDHLRQLSSIMVLQQKELRKISNSLSTPYESQALELRRQAGKWLDRGRSKVMSDDSRTDDFHDAMGLLLKIIENPIGNQDYVTWFEIGWLRWKLETDIAGAEQAFRRAARLSGENADLYHSLSLRHVAHMLYLKGDIESAFEILLRNFEPTCRIIGVPFDLARYAARTGRTSKAIKLLEYCIDRQPTILITMFAEEDFRG